MLWAVLWGYRQGKAHGLMKAAAAFIFTGDHTVTNAVALLFQHTQQLLVQIPADPPSLGFGSQIDGKIRAPHIGGALKIGPGIGIAQDLPVFLGNKPRKLPQGLLDPQSHFRRRGRHIFKRDRGSGNIGCINGGNCRCIRDLCHANLHKYPSLWEYFITKERSAQCLQKNHLLFLGKMRTLCYNTFNIAMTGEI